MRKRRAIAAGRRGAKPLSLAVATAPGSKQAATATSPAFDQGLPPARLPPAHDPARRALTELHAPNVIKTIPRLQGKRRNTSSGRSVAVRPLELNARGASTPVLFRHRSQHPTHDLQLRAPTPEAAVRADSRAKKQRRTKPNDSTQTKLVYRARSQPEPGLPPLPESPPDAHNVSMSDSQSQDDVILLATSQAPFQEPRVNPRGSRAALQARVAAAEAANVTDTPRRAGHSLGSQRTFHPMVSQSQQPHELMMMSQMSDFCTPQDQPVHEKTDMERKEDILRAHILKKPRPRKNGPRSPLSYMQGLSNGLSGATAVDAAMLSASQSQSQDFDALLFGPPAAPRKGGHQPRNHRVAASLSPPPLSQPHANPFAHVMQDATQAAIASELRRIEKQRSKTYMKAPTTTDSYFVNTYEIIRAIDKGDFGEVLKCLHRLDGCLYAIKRLSRPYAGGTLNKTSMLGEALALAAIAQCGGGSAGSAAMHPGAAHIVRYFNAWREGTTAYIAYEWCTGGSLGAKLKTLSGKENRSIGPGSEVSTATVRVLTVAYQISLALAHIHALGLAHLDVKPDNILLAASGLYKLGDFGLVTVMDTSGAGQTIPMEGDRRYLPQEALGDVLHALDKIDMFALGVSLLETAIAPQALPAATSDAWQAVRHGKVGALPRIAGVPEFVHEMIGSLLRNDPAARPSASDVSLAVQQFCGQYPRIGSHVFANGVGAAVPQQVLQQQLQSVQELESCVQQRDAVIARLRAQLVQETR